MLKVSEWSEAFAKDGVIPCMLRHVTSIIPNNLLVQHIAHSPVTNCRTTSDVFFLNVNNVHHMSEIPIFSKSQRNVLLASASIAMWLAFS